jgi:L-alanine-DL-glutamate epimerase-like enolase superfamily enzyme
MTTVEISSVRVATFRAPLPVPVVFGNWVMRHREFALCGVVADDGSVGVSFCYTRDGPIAALADRLVAPHYLGGDPREPEGMFDRAAASNRAVLASGVGYRALSLVDVATWDLAAKLDGLTIEALLGGQPRDQLATAIVGYPPTMTADEVGTQVSDLIDQGWRRFKLPIAATAETTIDRLSAVRRLGEELWLGLDANWVFNQPQDAIAYIRALEPLQLGWVEDLMPPGNARNIATVRRAVEVPIAMGDEQGGAYHPEALVLAEAVDVVRLDASTNGGVTGLRRVLADLDGRHFSTHMFPHVHSRLLSAIGIEGAPVEWGIVGNGVDQVTDRFSRPTLVDGRMQPLPQDPGFGMTIDAEWLAGQSVDDPHDLIGALA